MIDHATHIVSVVKDELTKAALASGVDKSFVGYVVAPVGPLPTQTQAGDVIIVPSWILTVTVRSDLLGLPPVVMPVTIPGALPPDETFRDAARQALKMAVEEKDKQTT